MFNHTCTGWFVSFDAPSFITSLISFAHTDMEESLLKDLMARLSEDGYVPYLTSVGGSGLGILSPYDPNNYDDHPTATAHTQTPPETPGDESALGGREPLRATLQSKPLHNLSEWASNRGRWMYV